jgi:hypothetical protein
LKKVQVRKNNVLLLAGALSFITILLSGCLKSVENTPPKPMAFFSVLHLAPRAPSVEIYFNSDKASNPFTSGSYTDTYNDVEPGFFSITFKKASSDSVVASIPTGIYDSLKYYTVLIYNTPDTLVAADAIYDDFSDLTNDRAYYRFFHMSPDIGNIDLYLNNDKVQNTRMYADNVMGSSSYNQFGSVTNGTYNIFVKKAGSDSVIAQTSATLYNANAYTIFLKGIPGGSGNNALGIGVLQASN